MRVVYILLICACSHEAPPTTVTVAPLPTHSVDDANANANANANARATATVTAMVEPPRVEDVQHTIAHLRIAFRACYNRGLATDPTLSGSVNLTFKLAPDGSVSSISKSGGTGLTLDVETCIQDKIRSTRFEPPDPNGSTINLPLRFQSSP